MGISSHIVGFGSGGRTEKHDTDILYNQTTTLINKLSFKILLSF